MEDEIADRMDEQEERDRRLMEEFAESRVSVKALLWGIGQLFPKGVSSDFAKIFFAGPMDDMSGFLMFLYLPDDFVDWQHWLSPELEQGWVVLAEQDGKTFICPTRRGLKAIERQRSTLPTSFIGDWSRLLADSQEPYRETEIRALVR